MTPEAHARAVAAIVSALGYDTTHRGEVVRKPFLGLRVYDEAGLCVRFYTAAQLRALEDDRGVVEGFAEALPVGGHPI